MSIVQKRKKSLKLLLRLAEQRLGIIRHEGFSQQQGEATLAYESVCSRAEGGPEDNANKATGMVVHGLLGSGRNWRTFARNLANESASTSGRPWRMVMVDQRNHGSSALLRNLHPPHSIEAAAGDLTRLVDEEFQGRVPHSMLGHSLGGKTVLEFLRQRSSDGQQLPKQVWVLDSPLGRWTSDRPTDTDRVINEILNIPLPVPSRRWLYDYMAERGYSEAIRHWLGSNLVPDNGGFRWAFDISGAAAMFNSYKRLDYWDLLQKPPPDVDIHIVRAANSDRWSKAELAQLDSVGEASGGQVKVHVLADAGHWLHVENPNGLLSLISPALAKAPDS